MKAAHLVSYEWSQEGKARRRARSAPADPTGEHWAGRPWVKLFKFREAPGIEELCAQLDNVAHIMRNTVLHRRHGAMQVEVIPQPRQSRSNARTSSWTRTQSV